ncbi:hypothetical protein [Oceanobacillus oncorhynchi]|uniref:hypothetical protein n=1 Tax=Oceanobacillus oncorhynchi TaxID=545501 RepID=UPI002F96E718
MEEGIGIVVVELKRELIRDNQYDKAIHLMAVMYIIKSLGGILMKRNKGIKLSALRCWLLPTLNGLEYN